MKTRAKLVYPSYHFKPEDWLGFTEMKPFTRLWERLGLTDEDLQLIQTAIICAPKGNPIIPGTGGVRKLRFQRVGAHHGKSGGMRACYGYFDEYKKVVLFLVYPKNMKENIEDEEKKHLRNAMERIEKELGSPAI
jgi:hypothetical protein